MLSTGLVLLQVLTYWRDRPKLYITPHTDHRRDEAPAIGLDVANRGRQMTTLIEVGFFLDVQATVRSDADGPETVQGRRSRCPERRVRREDDG